MGSESGRGHQVSSAGSPIESAAKIGELDLHPIERHALIGPIPHVPVGNSLVGEIGGVTIPDLVDRAGRVQSLLGELADRFQHCVPRLPRKT